MNQVYFALKTDFWEKINQKKCFPRILDIMWRCTEAQTNDKFHHHVLMIRQNHLLILQLTQDINCTQEGHRRVMKRMREENIYCFNLLLTAWLDTKTILTRILIRTVRTGSLALLIHGIPIMSSSSVVTNYQSFKCLGSLTHTTVDLKKYLIKPCSAPCHSQSPLCQPRLAE